jgi:hypothetical protein
MIRYKVSGSIIQEPNGEFIYYSDVLRLRTETIEFVSNLLDQTTTSELSKLKALDALNVFFKFSIE